MRVDASDIIGFSHVPYIGRTLQPMHGLGCLSKLCPSVLHGARVCSARTLCPRSCVFLIFSGTCCWAAAAVSTLGRGGNSGSAEGRHVKSMEMHMCGADACRRNEGDDVCWAQTETIDNCQTTTRLLSAHELFFFRSS